MTSHDEMSKACTIPKEILEGLTTDELIDLVLTYPLLCDIYAYDSYQQGLEALAINFNGIGELINREDGAKKLLEKYIQLNILDIKTSDADMAILEVIYINQGNSEKISRHNSRAYEKLLADGNFMTNIVMLEALLGQDEVLGKLSDEEIVILLDTIGKNYVEMQSKKLYDGFNVFFQVIEKSSILHSSSAESKVGDTTNTTATTTTVLTPKGNQVEVYVFDYYGLEWAYAVTAQFEQAYPSATRISPADNRYNCHSYAWYLASTSNRYWMDDPGLYMSDGSYTRVGTSPTANNQKVIWLTIPLSNPCVHSGIVQNYSSKTIVSKWGQGPIMQHSVTYSPYTSNTIEYYK